MTSPDILPVNFTISPAAKREIEKIRQQWDNELPDKAAVLVIGWSLVQYNSGDESEGVFVSFYGQSQLPDIAHGIQHVSGIDVVFFTTPQYHPKFEGKVVDHADDRGFFLANP